MPGKVGRHVGARLLRQCIGWKSAGYGDRRRSTGTKTGSVFGIVVPLTAKRLPVLHQIAGTLTHPAIEELHAQAVSPCLIAACSPCLELRDSAEKVRVGPGHQASPKLPGAMQ